MTRYEVRCCCRPDNLLGWLETDLFERWGRQEVTIPVNVEHEPARARWEHGCSPDSSARIQLISLKLKNYVPAGKYLKDGYPAIASNNISLSLFKMIPGFTENKEVQQ